MSGGQINTTGEIWIGGIGVSNSQMTGGELNSGQWLAVGRNVPGTNSVFTLRVGRSTPRQVGGWLVVGGSTEGRVPSMRATVLSTRWSQESGSLRRRTGRHGTANLSGIVDVNGGWLRIGGHDNSVGEVNVTGSTVSTSVTDFSLGLDDLGNDTTALVH